MIRATKLDHSNLLLDKILLKAINEAIKHPINLNLKEGSLLLGVGVC